MTISDKKLQVSAGGAVVDYYAADAVSATDYYPFGMDMPGRKFGGAGRYGFNGKERDKYMNSLTAYDYGFRIYNPAIGKFLSVDPLTKSYPELTPYQFASNTPIMAVDLDRAEAKPYHGVNSKLKDGRTVFKAYNIIEFKEDNRKFNVAMYPTKLFDGNGINDWKYPRSVAMVEDKSMINQSDYDVGDGTVIRTKGTHWHYWMHTNELSEASKVVNSVHDGLAVGTFGVAAVGVALPAAIYVAPTVINSTATFGRFAWQGLKNEASLLKYIPKSYLPFAQSFAANLGLQLTFNGKNADVWDAATSTINPFLALFTNPVVDYRPLAGDITPGISSDKPHVMAKNFLISAPFTLFGVSVNTVSPMSATKEYLLNTAEEASQSATPDKKN